jgi:hypothetical protein
MLRRVALVRTDVSDELSASFIRVTRIGELWTTLAVTSNRRTLHISKMVSCIDVSHPRFAALFHSPPARCMFLPQCFSTLLWAQFKVTLSSRDITLCWQLQAAGQDWNMLSCYIAAPCCEASCTGCTCRPPSTNTSLGFDIMTWNGSTIALPCYHYTRRHTPYLLGHVACIMHLPSRS